MTFRSDGKTSWNGPCHERLDFRIFVKMRVSLDDCFQFRWRSSAISAKATAQEQCLDQTHWNDSQQQPDMPGSRQRQRINAIQYLRGFSILLTKGILTQSVQPLSIRRGKGKNTSHRAIGAFAKDLKCAISVRRIERNHEMH